MVCYGRNALRFGHWAFTAKNWRPPKPAFPEMDFEEHLPSHGLSVLNSIEPSNFGQSRWTCGQMHRSLQSSWDLFFFPNISRLHPRKSKDTGHTPHPLQLCHDPEKGDCDFTFNSKKSLLIRSLAVFGGVNSSHYMP